MKKYSPVILSLLVLCGTLSAQAANSIVPTLELEKKIAYQQGQFGALYDHCGSADEKAVINGSLASWRTETFLGYKGTSEERAQLEKTFDIAAGEVAANPSSCKEWVKQAAVTWKGIIQLTEYGTPAIASK